MFFHVLNRWESCVRYALGLECQGLGIQLLNNVEYVRVIISYLMVLVVT